MPLEAANSSIPSLTRRPGMRRNGARRGAVGQRRGHRRDALLDLLPGAVERQPIACRSDGSGCGWPPCGRRRAPCARLPDWRWPGVRPGRRSPSRSGRRECQDLVSCISAADRRRRSAPPHDLQAAASWLYCMVPMMGWARGSTTMRARRADGVGMAWAIGRRRSLRGDTSVSRPTHKAAKGGRRSPPYIRLAIIEPRLHSRRNATVTYRRHECRLNRLNSYTANLASAP